jgi:acyl dehydratase
VSDPDLDAIKERWIGEQFDIATFTANQDDMLAWAKACGETDTRFTDPEHPDFQAHPGFTTHLVSRRVLPEDFPQISGRGIDGGKSVVVNGPIRAGDELTATVTVADIYEKTGRSGTMVFIVQRMSFVNQDDAQVSTVDWRMIRNIK